jgi:ornithine cyclodeaminase/alanine dehydrogenase-like protein (mu-crystallin family)
MTQNNTLIITNEQIKKVLSLEDVIRGVEDTWRWHGEGKVILPPKVTTDMSAAGVEGWFNSMPSYIAPKDIAGIKVVGGYKNNPRQGLPYIRANILLLDPHNGTLRAILCGDWISDARTGAQPAVAMKYLAAKTDVVTIIGAGLQARYCVMCISRSHQIRELRVCDINPEALEKFASFFQDEYFKLTTYDNNEEACRDADVIITVTTANAVLVKEPWCKPGCLVLTMGSYTEVDDEIPRKFDRLLVDNIAQALHRGNFKEMADRGEITAKSFAAEIPDVVAGKTAGRIDPTQRIVAALIGMGSLDLAVAEEAFKRLTVSGEKVLQVNMIGEKTR